MTGAEFAAKIRGLLIAHVYITEDVDVIARAFDAAVAELTAERDRLALDFANCADVGRRLEAQLAAANERATKAESECAAWRREADAAAHAGLRAQDRAERAEAALGRHAAELWTAYEQEHEAVGRSLESDLSRSIRAAHARVEALRAVKP